MAAFGSQSRRNRATCHPLLQEVFDEVVKGYDCTWITGYRSREEQDRMFNLQRSKLRWPQSLHNRNPSHAADVAPYPIDWGDQGDRTRRSKAIARFYHFAGYVFAVADSLLIPLRWGGDWDSDFDFSDQKFDDLIHFELAMSPERIVDAEGNKLLSASYFQR